MIRAADRRPIRQTGCTVPVLGIGTATFGGLYRSVAESDVRAVVHGALARHLGFFDTAPLYGHSVAERRLGSALTGTPRAEFVLSTKVGRVLVPDADAHASLFEDAAQYRPVFDFSAAGIRHSLTESLARLNVDYVDIALIHDPDGHLDQAIAESYPALEALRADGLVRAIGIGVNHVDTAIRFVRETDLDVVLLAGRYTLLDRSAETELLPMCADRDVAVIIGGVFNSGILADPTAGARFNYRDAPPDLIARARSMHAICADHDVPLTAAALQFPLRHSAVTAVLTGVRNQAELEANANDIELPVPPELWSTLDMVGQVGAVTRD